MIRIGDMRHRVRIEQRSTAQDASGEALLSWILVKEVYAALQATPGSEVWASAQRSGRVPTIFRIRYLSTVVPEMRLTWNGKVFDIKSAVDQGGRKEEMILTTEELVGEAP